MYASYAVMLPWSMPRYKEHSVSSRDLFRKLFQVILYNGYERSLDVTPEIKSRSLYLQFQKRNCEQQHNSLFGSKSSCGGSNSGSPGREGRHPFVFHVADFLEIFSLYPTTCLSCLPFVAWISRQYLCHALTKDIPLFVTKKTQMGFSSWSHDAQERALCRPHRLVSVIHNLTFIYRNIIAPSAPITKL
jgi:hypothetical protein